MHVCDVMDYIFPIFFPIIEVPEVTKVKTKPEPAKKGMHIFFFFSEF